MRFKCVFRDSIGFVRIIDFEADSLEAATVGLHMRCREDIKAVEGVDKSKMMVWLDFLIDEAGDHFRIYYAEEGENPGMPTVQDITGDKGVVIKERPFPEAAEMQKVSQTGVKNVGNY